MRRTPTRSVDSRGRIHVPRSTKPIYDDAPSIQGPSVIGLFDPHIPFHDGAFMEKVLNLGACWGIRNVIVGGDFFDMTAFSHFDPDPDDTLEAELDMGEKVMKVLTDEFAKVYYIQGNHEWRMLGRKLQRQLKTDRFKRLFTFANNLTLTSYRKAKMDTPMGTWVFSHPPNVSRNPGVVPSRLQALNHRGCHVMSGHGHLAGLIRADDGKHWCMDTGMCADRARLDYVMKDDRAYPTMCQGAGIVYRGHPYLITDDMDWKAMERMHGSKRAR